MSVIGQLTKYALTEVGLTALKVTAQHVGVAVGNEVGKKAAKESVKAFKEKVLKEEPVQPKPSFNTGNPAVDMALSAVMAQVAAKKANAANNKPQNNSGITIDGTAVNVENEPTVSTTNTAANIAEELGSKVADVTDGTVNKARAIAQGFKRGFNK